MSPHTPKLKGWLAVWAKQEPATKASDSKDTGTKRFNIATPFGKKFKC
jgi:hypothetical protein